ncbi:hypothetical protein, partial [Janthinobacterium sp. LB2P10]|uniref:hypothetical protein n=1 Tax=Janthinobacterium sp. LB2P10 TaxID=3424194 RepID=UPI003F203F02
WLNYCVHNRVCGHNRFVSQPQIMLAGVVEVKTALALRLPSSLSFGILQANKGIHRTTTNTEHGRRMNIF